MGGLGENAWGGRVRYRFFFVLRIFDVKKNETGSLFEMDLDSLVYVVEVLPRP